MIATNASRARSPESRDPGLGARAVLVPAVLQGESTEVPPLRFASVGKSEMYLLACVNDQQFLVDFPSAVIGVGGPGVGAMPETSIQEAIATVEEKTTTSER